MLFIGYFKGEPTEYVMKYRAGTLSKSGRGLDFFYLKMNTSIVSIPVGTADVPFMLNETTGNFQSVTVQGQLTYRIANPESIAQLMDYTIDAGTRKYKSEDPEKLPGRIINEVQASLKVELQKLSLEDALKSPAEISAKISKALRESKTLSNMGIETLALYITAIKPTPEMARALEAEYRENLQIRADQAIYNRRAMAVEQERIIRENELSTSISLENKKAELIELQGKNTRQEAEYQAQALQCRLAPFKDITHSKILALALREIGENAGKIGNLNISSEILASILASGRTHELNQAEENECQRK
ncbi:MAG: SPFH domain-containing protein [Candidatus Riflebacteria bacterium]|nr:SPFH domain-containing protein [Candidatus Riflebacteria bacterium]